MVKRPNQTNDETAWVGLSHEIWAAAQLLPTESIMDGVARIDQILRENFGKQTTKGK